MPEFPLRLSNALFWLIFWAIYHLKRHYSCRCICFASIHLIFDDSAFDLHFFFCRLWPLKLFFSYAMVVAVDGETFYFGCLCSKVGARIFEHEKRDNNRVQYDVCLCGEYDSAKVNAKQPHPNTREGARENPSPTEVMQREKYAMRMSFGNCHFSKYANYANRSLP